MTELVRGRAGILRQNYLSHASLLAVHECVTATAGQKAHDGACAHAGILRQNYRSHASLLSIPNRLFYGDQLQAAADQQALQPPQWAPLRHAQPQQETSQGAQAEEEAEEGELLRKRTYVLRTLLREEGSISKRFRLRTSHPHYALHCPWCCLISWLQHLIQTVPMKGNGLFSACAQLPTFWEVLLQQMVQQMQRQRQKLELRRQRRSQTRPRKPRRVRKTKRPCRMITSPVPCSMAFVVNRCSSAK